MVSVYIYLSDSPPSEKYSSMDILVRFSCAVVIHLSNQQEVRTALQMIKFVRNYRKTLKYSDMSYHIALMKFISAIFAQIGSLYIICTEDTV